MTIKLVTLLWLIVSVSLNVYGQYDSQKNNQMADSVIQLAAELYAQKEYHRASRILENVISKKIQIEQQKMLHLNLYLGANYIQLGNYNHALNCYNKAEQYVNDKESKAYFIYYGKAIVYSLTGDFTRAIQLLENALSTIDKNNSHWLRNILWELGKAHYEQNGYEKALGYYEKSIQLAKQYKLKGLEHIFNDYARSYQKIGDYEEAEKYFLKSIELSKQQSNSQYPVALGYMNLGNLKIQGDQLNEGYAYLIKALKLYSKTMGNEHPQTAFCKYQIGKYYVKTGDVSSALDWFQLALMSKVSKFSNPLVGTNPELEQIFPDKDILDILKAKAEAFYLRWNKTNALSDLENSKNTLELITQLITKMRLGYLLEQSSLDLSAREKETYLNIIDANITMYRVTSNKNYLTDAFSYSDKIKHATFKAYVQETNAKQKANIPDSLLSKETYLKQQIASYQKLIHDERLLKSPNLTRIEEWKTDLFNLYQKLEIFIRNLETSYKTYHQLKYDNTGVDIAKIQNKLGRLDALVDYTIADTLLYTFVLTNKDINVYTVPIDTVFYTRLMEFKTEMYREGFLNYDSYKQCAYYLFNTLIKPIEINPKIENIIIIPDESLAYVSFDVLLTEPYIITDYTYKKVPFLIKKYSFSYLFYASMFNVENKRYKNSTVVFAPSYKNTKYDNLRFIYDEAQYVADMMNGDAFLYEDATETNFKKHCHNHSIFHLAMHNDIDSLNSSYSGLIFYQKDEHNDSRLYNYELNNMSFKTNMVVLSACHSGYGTLHKSEGMMSMARGFLQSGSLSVVVSLWSSSDLSDSKIYKYYYKNLKKGMSKPVAMRQAKLKHLNKVESMETSPILWGNIIVIGDHSSLYPSRWLFLLTITFMIVAITAILKIRIRKS